MRRTYLIDKKFQHRFALEMILFVLVVPFLVWVNVFVFGLVSIDKAEFTNAARSNSGIIMLILSKQWLAMVIVYCLNIVAIYALIVYHSHRIAGPVYRFANALRRVGEGDLTQQIKLRKYDFLKDLGIEINRVAHTQKDTVDELRRINRALNNLNQSLNHPSLARELANLESVLKRYRTDEDVAAATNDTDVLPSSVT